MIQGAADRRANFGTGDLVILDGLTGLNAGSLLTGGFLDVTTDLTPLV